MKLCYNSIHLKGIRMDRIILELKKYKNIIIGIVVVFVVIILVFLLLPNDSSKGIDYIKETESKDPSSLSEQLSEKRLAERKQAIADGKLDVFGLFDDYLILGDSRATGFYLYGYLLESRVYAYNGATILSIDEWIDSIQKLQPQNIYVSFGMNDIKNNLNDSSNGGYSQLLSEQIKKVLNVCPQATIYVNSIIPASQSTTQSNSDLWSQIDVYNAQIQQACQDNGWTYIDNSSLVQDQSESIYESDGIHFVSSFYEKWARNIMGVLE